MIRDVHPESSIRILIFNHPGSPDPGVEKSPDPGPQHFQNAREFMIEIRFKDVGRAECGYCYKLCLCSPGRYVFIFEHDPKARASTPWTASSPVLMEDVGEVMIFPLKEAAKDGSYRLLWRGFLSCELLCSPAAGLRWTSSQYCEVQLLEYSLARSTNNQHSSCLASHVSTLVYPCFLLGCLLWGEGRTLFVLFCIPVAVGKWAI